MRVWLACFLVLFALAELFDWVKEFTLPLPIYILGGAFLAVASNYDKLFGFYFGHATSQATLEQPLLDDSPSLKISHSVEESQKSEIKS